MKRAVIATGILFGLLSCSPSERAEGPPKAREKRGVVELIRDGGLDGFVHYFKEESPTKNRDEAWEIEDGVLHITGKGWGYLRTKEQYENYRLVVEYKWGEFTDGLRENRARDSGIFVHASGEDGAFRGAWVSSFEAQMIEGRAGDLIVIAALDPESGEKARHQLITSAREIKVPDGASDYEHAPDAEHLELPSPRSERVRIFRNPRDTAWKDEKGYLGPEPIENPAGEWNKLVVHCEGDFIKVILNDHIVNQVWSVTPAKGYICIQSELSECWIRRLKLQPIKKQPQSGEESGKN